VILGQDPYPTRGQAHGLAFSVPAGVARLPRSLRTILKVWSSDTDSRSPADGSLELWARHGVLLLNTVLTVREGVPGSHAGRGWEKLTGAVVEAVASKPEPVVFLLWGADAQRSRRRIDEERRHIVLAASHPSPRSAYRRCGDSPCFVGAAPFRRANEELDRLGQPPIDWSLSAR
jgi:uracil-DNA glycosylase